MLDQVIKELERIAKEPRGSKGGPAKVATTRSKAMAAVREV